MVIKDAGVNMAGWIIDETPLIKIKYDLLRQKRVGKIKLGFIGLGDNDAQASLINGGLVAGWLPDTINNPSLGILVRKFSVLLILPVTIEICKQITGFQMGSRFYKKTTEIPYDGVSTPQEWIYNVSYVGDNSNIVL